MFYQIFLSPQVKRWSIITYKHGTYELPHKLSNFAAGGAKVPTQKKKKDLGNLALLGKCLNPIK